MTDIREQDPVERLAAYRPTRTQIDAEWTATRRAAVRSQVLATPGRARLSWRPASHRRVLNASVLTAAAIVALLVGVLLVVMRPSHDTGGGAGEPVSAGQGNFTVGSGQFAQRAMTTYELSADGTATTTAQGVVWAAPDGSLWMNGNLSAAGCLHAPAPSQPSFEEPTSDFFAQLPTSTGALESFMRAHVSGSSSQDEAIFVATGDMLRFTDLLASAQLRAAAVNVLSGISGISVHTGATDYLGRPAVRVDWVDQALRPGELSSLYFDPTTYQLVEERNGPSGAPNSYDGPSPAYTAHATGQDPTSEQLANPASLTIVTSESVVDSVPADVLSCPDI